VTKQLAIREGKDLAHIEQRISSDNSALALIEVGKLFEFFMAHPYLAKKWLNRFYPLTSVLITRILVSWWDWPALSQNESLPWSEELIERFGDKWDWHSLSHNKSLPWSEDLIAKYKDKWNWRTLSHNRFLPWSEDLIAQYEDRLDWYYLSHNSSLPWSEDLIIKYEDRWNWKKLSENQSLGL
jgi:hypothetical protein